MLIQLWSTLPPLDSYLFITWYTSLFFLKLEFGQATITKAHSGNEAWKPHSMCYTFRLAVSKACVLPLYHRAPLMSNVKTHQGATLRWHCMTFISITINISASNKICFWSWYIATTYCCTENTQYSIKCARSQALLGLFFKTTYILTFNFSITPASIIHIWIPNHSLCVLGEFWEAAGWGNVRKWVIGLHLIWTCGMRGILQTNEQCVSIPERDFALKKKQ